MVDKKSTPVFLHSLQLNNYKCFKGENSFSFGNNYRNNKVSIPQCTVFLGNNGTGKTNLLKTIANISPEIKKIAEQERGKGYATEIPDLCAIGLPETREAISKAKELIAYRPSVIERHDDISYSVLAEFACYRGSKKEIFKERFSVLGRKGTTYSEEDNENVDAIEFASIGYSSQFNNVVYNVSELEHLKIYAYGVNRFSDTQRNLVSDNLVNSLFYNNTPLINLEEWLLQLEIAKSKKPGVSKRIKLIKGILKRSNLFPDIEDYYIHVDDNYNSEVLFKTKEGDFRLNDLGYGYQCMFAWVFDFMKKMFDRYSKSNNPLEEPAVLLIDEIDLHLHPQWQRHVIKDLCELFPNTQLIVTTHSPLVIQSIDSINLFILSKEGDHTKVTHCTEDTFQGWSVEEILRELMDLGDNIRSPKYEKLRDDFESAMNRADLKKGERAYNELKKILHPQNVENKLLDMDLGQLKAMQDD